MITIAELFPKYKTALKWYIVLGKDVDQEKVRLAKEYTEHKVTKHIVGRLETWKIGEMFHRKDGPAYVLYYTDGAIQEQWYRFGKRHRTDGPAIITRNHGYTGQVWYKKGICQKSEVIRSEV